jgi:hypothetical protein
LKKRLSPISWLISLCLIILSAPGVFPSNPPPRQEIVVLKPEESTTAIRNPLKGFRSNYLHPFATLNKTYIRWSDLENVASDGVDKIRRYCDERWKGYPQHNMKAIPRVWLYMPNEPIGGWPSDLDAGDYSSPRFRERVVRLVRKLGEAWDNDPRVAYVEMGIIGYWGEHHHPAITKEMEKVLGDAFAVAFKKKLVMIRYPRDFQGYGFGIYWDSWAHYQQNESKEEGGKGIAALGDLWKTAVIGGETAYDWGDYRVHPGDDPNDTLGSPEHLDFLLDTIRRYHCNHLGVVADYDSKKPEVLQGAETVQKALGYRFVLEEVRYPKVLHAGEGFGISFVVRNVGSSPFYYNWPVELSLLDPATRQPVWKENFRGVDVTKWLPGDRWETDYRIPVVRPGERDASGKQVDFGAIIDHKAYLAPPQRYVARGAFTLSKQIPPGRYIVALAILDPAGMLPSARFAIKNYFIGGRHPIGYVGVGTEISTAEIDPRLFNEVADDATLHYLMESGSAQTRVSAGPAPVRGKEMGAGKETYERPR